MEDVDFAYDYEKRVNSSIERIKATDKILNANKKTIFNFLESYKKEYERNHGKQLSQATISKAIDRLYMIGVIVGGRSFNSIDTVEKMDKFLLNHIEENGYKANSVKTIKIYVKMLWRFIRFNDCYYPDDPTETKRIRIVAPEEKLREEDVMNDIQFIKCMSVEQDLQYRAIFFLMRYAGLRESEVLNMRISSVRKDDLGCQVEVTGKTGTRVARMFNHWNTLFQWIEKSPNKGDGDSPLWVVKKVEYEKRKRKFVTVEDKTRPKGKRVAEIPKKVIAIQYMPMDYDNLKQRWYRDQLMAGMKRTFSLHNLRKQNTIWLLRQGYNSDTININQGRRLGSRSMSRYSIWNDSKVVDNEYAKKIGKLSEVPEDKTAPKVCDVCKTTNSPEKDYCENCFRPLDMKKALKLDAKRKWLDNQFEQFIKQKGILEKI
jgi:integrase